MTETVSDVLRELCADDRNFTDPAADYVIGMKHAIAQRIQAAHAREVGELKRDLEGYMQAANYEANRSAEAELEADRLDWLLSNGARVSRFRDQYRVEGSDTVLSDWCPTARAAIDAAMSTPTREVIT